MSSRQQLALAIPTRYDKARWFASRDEARLWAESYEGDDWLAIRAEIAKSEPVPPNDVVFE